MNSTHKHALIVGPYRAHNFGDDLVGAIIARHLQSRGYAVSIPRLGPENSAWLGSEYSETYDGQFEKADVIVVGGGGILSDTSGAKPGASYLDLVARAGVRLHEFVPPELFLEPRSNREFARRFQGSPLMRAGRKRLQALAAHLAAKRAPQQSAADGEPQRPGS